MHFVYSPRYHADIGIHVFPIKKYHLVAEALSQKHQIPDAAFIEPLPATHEQLLRVHTERYLDDLYNCRWTPRTQDSELPLTREIVDMFILASGGTILAAELALAEGACVHIGGGFHHAFAEKAEGFCYINDLAVAIREMQTREKIQKAMVIDCDLHQGNGTANIFQQDKSVFTFSIHQWELYPVKEKSDFDIHLENGITDEEYWRHLENHIPDILDDFRPDLILYQAGADPFEYDQLGDLKLSIHGLSERDRLIFGWAKKRSIPVAVTLGGGYAYNTIDTVAIHVNTSLSAWEIWQN
ncbi:MAG: histone deacetylase [candidate division KSB1 bacterium]|nr:histone deacetylase [candidate division KSB1 bacterium]MDZ7304266.1 histone deacetylase [candidate division KSB1 bacterium]MDZ7312882.1 histone deacetylase [candidate division KSB1 bacterium]